MAHPPLRSLADWLRSMTAGVKRPFAVACTLLLGSLLTGCSSIADTSGTHNQSAARVTPPSAPRATPFLMFQNGRAHDALEFYAATLPDTRLVAIERYGPDDVGPEGTVEFATLDLAGQRVHCTDSPVPHAFEFTPSFSFWFECESLDAVDRLAAALSADGTVLMPPADYGFAPRFAWVQDRFGVSWQLVFNDA